MSDQNESFETLWQDLKLTEAEHKKDPRDMEQRRRYAKLLRRVNDHPDRFDLHGPRIQSALVKVCKCEGPHAVCYWCSNGAIIGTDGRG